MEPHVSEAVNWEQLQFVFSVILGGFSVVYGAILTYIFKELERLHTKDDSIIQMVMNQTNTTDERFRLAVDAIRSKMDIIVSKEEMQALRSSIEEDRKIAARDRENIAVMMATKESTKEMLERFGSNLMDVVDKRLTSNRKSGIGA